MDIKYLDDIHNKYDKILESDIMMDEANSIIDIYKGNFTIKDEDGIEIEILGIIQYVWFPSTGVIFSGHTVNQDLNIFKNINNLDYFQIVIGDVEFGKAYISHTEISDCIFIKGGCVHQAILGDKSISVEKIKFCVPNFINLTGSIVKKITNEKISLLKNRLELENEKFLIKIDKSYEYPERIKSLENNGGYAILYNGELKAKNSPINYNEADEILSCLSIFLNFLNGKRTSAIFRQGIFNNEIIWTDYSDYYVDNYKFYPSWVSRDSVSELNVMWQTFTKLWSSNEGNEDFIRTVIHWYVESNKSSGFIEGALIMAQTALELIFNWYIVESKHMIKGKDSENISASNKIRLLISQLNIDCNVPEKFITLNDYISKSSNIIDAPEAVVQIRNAIVHSQEEKRKKLLAINSKIKNEALQLCIWYIEMALLKIFSYDGIYLNRCSKEMVTSKKREYVPWKNIKVIFP